MQLKKVLSISQITILFLGVCFPNLSFSQKKWELQPFQQKVFVENNGQFINPLKKLFNGNNVSNNDSDEKILFSAKSSGVDLFFTINSLTYKHDEMVPMNQDEKEEYIRANPNYEKMGEEDEEGENKFSKVIPRYLTIEWLNANPDAEIISTDEVSHYYTYGSKETNTTIKANAFKKIIYKNIYKNIDIEYIFPEDKGGIKYSLILHPGANPSDIKMKYKNAENLHLLSNGDLVIESVFGEFIDHAPITFYAANNEKIKSSFSVNNSIVSFSLPSFVNNNLLGDIIIDPWTTNPNFVGFNSAYDINYDTLGNVYVLGSYGPFELSKYDNTGTLLWTYSTPLNFGQPLTVPYTYGDFVVDEASGSSYIGEGYNVPSGSNIIKVNTGGIQTALFNGGSGVLDEIWRMEYNRCINKIVMAGGGHNSIPPYQAGTIDTTLTNFTPVNILGANNFEIYHDFVLLALDNVKDTCFMATARDGNNSNIYNNIILKAPISTNLLPSTTIANSNHRFREVRAVRYINNINTNNNNLVASNGINGMAVSPDFLYTYNSDTLKRWNKTTGAFIGFIDVNPAAAWMANGSVQVSWGGLAVDECDNIYVGYKTTIQKYDSAFNLVTTYNLTDTVYDLKLGPNDKLYACGKSFVTEIDVPAIPFAITHTNAGSCTNCNGTASVNACFVGSQGVTYAWSTTPVQTTPTATGLCPGTYTVTVQVRCDKIFTDTVTIFGAGGSVSVTNFNASICAGQTFPLPWPPNTPVSNPGTYYDTLTNQAGCDSILIFTLVVTPVVITTINASICAGNTYTLPWPPNTPVSSTGNYSDTLTTSAGCDSILTVALTVTPAITSSINASICAGNTYTLPWPPNTPVSSPGNYSDTLTTSAGCDSIFTIALTVTPATTSSMNASICAGNTYTLPWPPNTSVSSAGNYSDTLTTSAGCDSIFTITLTVTPATTSSINASICSGSSYVLPWPPNTPVSSAGNYSDTLTTSGGCDSILTITLTITPAITSTMNASICTGNSYVLPWPPNTPVSSAGNYSDTLTTSSGCDSIFTINLTVTPAPVTNLTASICAGKTYTLPWFPFTPVSNAGIYFTTVNTSAGCDSIVNLNLTVTPAPIITLSVTVCQGDTYILPNGNIVSNAGVYTTPISSLGACDTTIVTVLTVAPSVGFIQNITICAGATYQLPDGTSTGTAGQYLDTLSNQNGCDSVVTTNLSVTPAPSTSQDPNVCEGEGFILPTGALANITGTYTDTINVNGCDNIVVTNLTVRPSTHDLIIPNVFTPNSDAKNDLFLIQGTSDCIDKFTIIVYNRWGLKIFESNKITAEWDGRVSNGAKADDGTYFYLIKIKTTGGEETEKSGFVTLLR